LKSKTNKEVTIIGAGLVGSLLSIYLTRRGYKVKILERRGDMRAERVEAGKSINLALSDRGILALKEVGIAEKILELAIPMHGRFIHNRDGSTAFQPYGKQGQFINSVSRHELNCALMALAEELGVNISFHQKCSSINWSEKKIQFEDDGIDKQVREKSFDILFGADGAYSAVRLTHMLQHQNFNYQQFYIDCGYKELSFPPGKNGRFLLEKHALHIWPRTNHMLIALPNLDGSFTGTLFFPFEGQLSFEKLNSKEAVNQFFQNEFPDVGILIPDLDRQFFDHPTSSLVTVKCFPWIREDYFSLIGDAAHAIVPFFGQGMNAGFEDCRVLNELIDIHNHNWEQILEEFQHWRKSDADAIADLAVNNFVEMREKTADPQFLLQKKIEPNLHEKYPEKWIPAYSQVTFSPQIRYSDALKNSLKQEKIMQEIMKLPDIEKNWQEERIQRMILSKISKEK
jgi:kynurenine 3-monooxygenase